MVNFMKKISLGNILKNMRLTNTTLSQKELGKNYHYPIQQFLLMNEKIVNLIFILYLKLLIYVIMIFVYIIEKQKNLYLLNIIQRNYKIYHSLKND